MGKLTVNKVVNELEKNYGWGGIKKGKKRNEEDIQMLLELIKDTLKIVDKYKPKEKPKVIGVDSDYNY